jgi:transposase-like protein
MDEKQNFEKEQPDELTNKMRQWRQANPKATLTEIEEAVEAELAQLRKRLVEEMVQEEAAGLPEEPDCPQCGGKMVKNGRRQRKLKGKEGQAIHLDRQQWRCLSCEATLFPPG